MGFSPPEMIEQSADAHHAVSALFGYVSGLSDGDFLAYVAAHRNHKTIRRIFFNEIRKRTELSVEAVDRTAEAFLNDIEAGVDRAKNETLLRYLVPTMSMQMRTRTVRCILRYGTKTTQSYLLRKLSPDLAPGIEDAVYDLALNQKHEDALVGIVYRWPRLTISNRCRDSKRNL
jgi:hypothetical protein